MDREGALGPLQSRPRTRVVQLVKDLACSRAAGDRKEGGIPGRDILSGQTVHGLAPFSDTWYYNLPEKSRACSF